MKKSESFWQRLRALDEVSWDNPLDAQLTAAATDEPDSELRRRAPMEFAMAEAKHEEMRESLYTQEQLQVNNLHMWVGHQGKKWLNVAYRITALLFCLVIITFLMTTVVQLPPFGAVENPTNNEVAQRYLEKGLEETGAVNMVAGMILDYRAFDTFGESTVLFVAACSVLLLLKLGEHKDNEPSPAMLEAEWDDRHHEPKNDAILQMAARVLVPVILLFGMYVVLAGHLGPGGGFSGGAVMGAGLILYLNAFGFEKTGRFFTYKTFRWVTFIALMTYALLKSYSFFCGANHLESGIPLGTPGAILSSGFILPLNICVGMIVMCTMYAFYTLFRKGGM